jgi:multiple sugar transport system permease protein
VSKNSKTKFDKVPWRAKVLLAPSIVTLFIIGIFPLLFAVVTSTKQYNVSKPYLPHTFLGISNYKAVLTDPAFYTALKTTFIFMAFALPIQIFLGLSIALFIYNLQAKRLATFLRVVLVLPIAVTPTVIGLLGRLLFNSDFGIINYVLHFAGLGPIQWLAGQNSAFIAVLILDTWQWVPFVTLVLLASLMVIPAGVLEAGKLDAGSGWKFFRYLQLPYLFPGFTALLILRTADILKMYDTTYAFTKGGPGVATEYVSLYITRIGFKVFDLGIASAQGVLLLMLCILLSRSYIKFFYREIEV